MYFVPWFITTYLPLFINILERSYEDGSGNIIKVVYPPHSSFTLPNNTGITFTAIQIFVEEDVAVVSINEINHLISQNNYLGLYVKVLGNSKAQIISIHVQSPSEIRDFKFKPLYDLEELLDKKLSEFGAKPIDLSDNFADEMKKKTSNSKNHVSLEFNKFRDYPKKNNNIKFSHKPSMQTYYYSRPTPQDVLIEERD
ncbi:hypothetical protein H5410_030582 [Solanum commersonii]|uniref:Uncharacterized protein n=1 Tax=Solanum commersonii TaxID=4109 RepID=A0A9J5YJ42_SOLCO|nr:hypothetical protein H5410_030582 [Solanum commersonii]